MTASPRLLIILAAMAGLLRLHLPQRDPPSPPTPLVDCPLADLARFPPAEEVLHLIDFQSAHERWLHVAVDAGLMPWGEWMEREGELWASWRAWTRLRDAQDEWRPVSSRRRCLRELRELLGPADYYAGRMPPIVPLERFVVVD